MKSPAMPRRLRAPSPALVISVIALFVALGGGAALASGLISGNQIVNHSIPAKKLTAAAIKTLHGQTGPAGPGAIAISHLVPAGSGLLTPDPLSGVSIFYNCDPATPSVRLALNSSDQVFYSGEYVVDGGITAVTPNEGGSSDINIDATHTVSLDLLASVDYGSHIWHIDLAEMFVAGPMGKHGCLVWGLITPGT